MLLITGTFRVSPDKLEEARPAMRRMIEGSRAEDGCITYGYADDILEPGLIHVTELWTDRAALEKHFTAPHLAEWRKALDQNKILLRELIDLDTSYGTDEDDLEEEDGDIANKI